MKRPIVLMSIVASCLAVHAGELYGTVYEGSAKVGEGTELSISCSGKDYPAAKTDKGGAYHLEVAETGKCNLTVKHKGAAASTEVVSFADGAQLDLLLELKDGKLTVRRK